MDWFIDWEELNILEKKRSCIEEETEAFDCLIIPD